MCVLSRKLNLEQQQEEIMTWETKKTDSAIYFAVFCHKYLYKYFMYI